MEAGPVAEAGVSGHDARGAAGNPRRDDKLAVNLLRISPRGLVVRAVRLLHQWGGGSPA